jgi:hypothetical protein
MRKRRIKLLNKKYIFAYHIKNNGAKVHILARQIYIINILSIIN